MLASNSLVFPKYFTREIRKRLCAFLLVTTYDLHISKDFWSYSKLSFDKVFRQIEQNLSFVGAGVREVVALCIGASITYLLVFSCVGPI